MKPDLNAYKILSMHQMYFVLNPYDLFAMPCLKISGHGFLTKKEAEESMIRLYEANLREYERCKKMGCSFPYND